MDSDDREEIREMIRQEMHALFFGTASGGVTSGEQDGTGRAGEQLVSVPLCQHYGHVSQPPSGTERLYAETQAGLVSIAERSTSAPSLVAGESAVYTDAGGIVKVKNTTSGRVVELGKGGTYKDSARKGDAVGAGSTPVNGMAVWIGLVSAALNAIAGGTIPVGCPSDFGTITGGSGTVGIED
jgi:phage gp45-like